MKKLNATTETTDMPGQWLVTVIDAVTGDETTVVVTAPTEKIAAFKAMDQVNEQ